MNPKERPFTRLERCMKERKAIKRLLKPLLKLLVTFLAFWYIFRQIDFGQVWESFGQANWGWLLLALLFFMLSKIIAAIRLNYFFRDQGLHISEKQNLFLYALGMFYNLFLPGGIGGDGYKVYWLNKHKEARIKSSILSMLLDRICGLLALLVLASVLFLSLPVIADYAFLRPFAWIGLIIAYPVYYLITRQLFTVYLPSWLRTNILALAVQSCQLVCILCIMLALGIQANWLAYETIFLVSSVIAVLPISIGGLGARELVFLVLSQSLHLQADVSISISLWFYLLSAITALSGAYFVLLPSKLDQSP